jgi:geranylgeranyl pyrophosphate synthase
VASGSKTIDHNQIVDREKWVVPHLDRVLDRARVSSGKRFRSRMVELSGRLILAHRQSPLNEEARSRLALAGQAIEDIHLGSLVIDDIQDGSHIRRGQPSLHRQVGVPLALNAGNWLYFSALKNLMKIPWSAVCECEAVDLAIESMLQAHEGQAIDLGVDITDVEDEMIASAVEASADRKTGALMAAAFGLGFLAAHPDGGFETRLYRDFQKFGREWGVALQMFDDLGAFQQSLLGLAPTEKLFEDFRNRRPCFFWTLAVACLGAKQNPPRKMVLQFLEELTTLDEVQPNFGFEDVAGAPTFSSFRDLIHSSKLIEYGAKLACERAEAAIGQLQAALGKENPELQTEFNLLRKISLDLAFAYGNFQALRNQGVEV